jgi:hypothetical protein
VPSRLVEQRATGVLLRDTGALHLADGAVAHAERPAAPGIEVLLTAGGLPAWFQSIGADPDAALMRRLPAALERL